MSDPVSTDRDYDLVGVGLGPANLALAIALREHNASAPPAQRLRYVFLERSGSFAWHRGMLLEDATMQIAFLKDLVTLRNPTSDFSFVSYLHERGRLPAFINHQSMFPSRREFHDYLEWAAARLADAVRYGNRVVEVCPVRSEQDDMDRLDVVAVDAATGDRVAYRARNVVLATGLEPELPPGVVLSDRVWHSEYLLHNLAGRTLRAAPAFVVVGAGQSAAEVVGHLHGRFPEGRVHAVLRRYGFSLADDSPFVNAIFDPDAVDTFFRAEASVQEMLLTYHRNTNYAVVDRDLIQELYRRHYQELVSGSPRLYFLRTSRVIETRESPDGLDVVIESLSTGRVHRVDADVLVYASGYRPSNPVSLLGATASCCKRDSKDRLRVGADYRVETTESMKCKIFLLGATEYAHGLSATLLSNAAVRADTVVRALTAGPPPEHWQSTSAVL